MKRARKVHKAAGDQWGNVTRLCGLVVGAFSYQRNQVTCARCLKALKRGKSK